MEEGITTKSYPFFFYIISPSNNGIFKSPIRAFKMVNLIVCSGEKEKPTGAK